MSTHIQTIKQKLWLYLEVLSETRLQEVLDFVEFLLHKDKSGKEQENAKPYTQQEILAALSEIRESIQQTYGLDQGDLMKLKDLIQDMTQIELEVSRFEKKFGVKSLDFYKAIMAGELEEFDALDEYRMEFIEWLALYKTWLSLNEKYKQLITRQPIAIQIKTAVLA